MESAGEISNLQRQVKYELQPGFSHGGKRQRAINYYADFVYDLDGKTVIEDHKGHITPEFAMKWKMMKYHYPDFAYLMSGKGK